MGKAVLIMFVAMSMIPAGDTAAKLLMATHDVAPVFVGWSRFLIGTLAVLPFVPGVTWALFGDWRIWMRALLLSVGITSIQLALRAEPIADVFAAFFIGPIFSYVLSPFLGSTLFEKGFSSLDAYFGKFLSIGCTNSFDVADLRHNGFLLKFWVGENRWVESLYL